MKLKGAIFDFDGTLFDSMSIWDTAGEDYLRSLGCEPSKELRQILKTMSLHQSASYFKREYHLPLTEEEIIDGINHTVEAFYYHTAMPKPGAAEFLEELRGRGVKMCIATATDRCQIEAALKRCRMEHYFQDILTCTAVGHSKSEPHIFKAALQRLDTAKEETLVFEDALHAIQTAKSAAFPVAAVFDPYESRQDEVRALADIYLADFQTLNSFWKFASTL